MLHYITNLRGAAFQRVIEEMGKPSKPADENIWDMLFSRAAI
jgi:hypothetical protein